MHEPAHANIMIGAYEALPEKYRKMLNADQALLYDAGNYPDYFDDPTRQEEKKNAIDTEWRKYCEYPPSLPAKFMHFWPTSLFDQNARRPLYEYLLGQMLHSLKSGDNASFIKFAGCLSHAMGDSTQPAHIGPDTNCTWLGQLMPKPDSPEFANFHYHSSTEAVIGKCGTLKPPRLMGGSIAETAWILAGQVNEAIIYCRRFIVPSIQALFAKDLQTAEALAVEPVTIAAQLTSDAMFTILEIHSGTVDTSAPSSVDLRLRKADAEFHDLVYGGAILDGNKDVPPCNVPATPGQLRLSDGVKNVKGLGVLPHSGMNGPRECSMTWKIPAGVFRHFSAQAGLHAQLAVNGAVSFHVLLDGKEVWTSGRMTIDDMAQIINLELGNHQEITLKVVDANNGTSFWKNHAFWADPQLIK